MQYKKRTNIHLYQNYIENTRKIINTCIYEHIHGEKKMRLNKYLLALLISVAPMNYAMSHNKVVRSVESNSIVKGSFGRCVHTMWQSTKNECMDDSMNMDHSMKMDEYIAYRAPTSKMAEIVVNFEFDSHMLDEANKMKIEGLKPLKDKDVKSIKLPVIPI